MLPVIIHHRNRAVGLPGAIDCGAVDCEVEHDERLGADASYRQVIGRRAVAVVDLVLRPLVGDAGRQMQLVHLQPQSKQRVIMLILAILKIWQLHKPQRFHKGRQNRHYS